MTFDAILAQVLDLLQHQGRVAYRALKVRFNLDDDYLEALKDELIYARRLAVDEADRVLVWTGATASVPLTAVPVQVQDQAPLSYTPKHLADKILTTRSALEGERKQVTVLFCDIANSTPLAARLGPEAMHTLLNRFFEVALDEVHRYEGTINQFLGDGFMALFGAPIAYEDHARRAVLAALGMQRRLTERRADFGLPSGEELAVRLGLNTGLVVVGGIGDNLRMDYTAVGDTTNLAARLQQNAPPGVILVSQTTSRLVQEQVYLEAIPLLQVKGQEAPVAAYKLLGHRPRRSPGVRLGERTLSRFAGRERELAVLHEVLAQVEAGQGQVVGIVAEAGVGKSRFLYEFRQSLTGKRLTYLAGSCLSYGQAIPYIPLLDFLRHNCGITEADSPETITARVRLGLQEVGLDPEAGAPYLLHLLGVQAGTEGLAVLSPETIKTRTFDTLRQMNLRGSRQQPLIFEVEDLHWIDKTSEDYLMSLVESLVGAPILLLGTYRPGYRPPWVEKSYAMQVSLRPLGPGDGLVVVRSVATRERLSDHLAQVILAKAEGNPFFLEELTRAVVEQGELQVDMAVPDNIQGVLMARIDRLPDATKRLLQTASALGREFSLRLLGTIWEGPSALEPLLGELKRLEFVYEDTGAEEPIYVFKHVLTQEVAYDSLLTTHRQALHAAAGRALEALYANHLDDAYDRLAYHYARTDEPDKAVNYLTRFAEKAARSYAHAEAAAALQEALGHVERLPAEAQDCSRLDLSIRQAESLFFSGRFQEVVDLLLEHRECVERLQDTLLASAYYVWLSATYSFLGHREQAVQNAESALQSAQQCGDTLSTISAHMWLAQECNFAGRYEQGIVHGRQAVSLLEQIEDRWFPVVNPYYVLAISYFGHGDFTLALEALVRLAAFGEATGDRRNQVHAACTIGLVYTEQGEWEAGIDICRQALEGSPDAFENAIVLGYLGYAYLEKGDIAQALPILEQALQQANQYRSRQVRAWFTTLLGEAYRLDGQFDKAHDLVRQGLAISVAIKAPMWIGLAQRALGRIALSSGALTEATTHLQDALQTFAVLPMRYHVGRTHLDLATLAHAQGNQTTAALHLSEAYALFRTLQVPKYVERTAQLAVAWEIPLTEESHE